MNVSLMNKRTGHCIRFKNVRLFDHCEYQGRPGFGLSFEDGRFQHYPSGEWRFVCASTNI